MTRQEALDRLLLAVEMAIDDFNAGNEVDFNQIREAFLATRQARDPDEPTEEELVAELSLLRSQLEKMEKMYP